jgi:carboxyl-terminal processing protease
MNRFALVGAGMAAGFLGAFMLFPVARGATDSSYHQLDLFRDAFDLVRKDYVRPVSDQELVTNAVGGMVSGLDPHSSYMDAKAFNDLKIQTSGQFGGVGIEVTLEDDLIKVIAPIDDTPAAHAGLKTGDFIAGIDGVPIQGIALDDAISKMRGQPGTKVTLTILRPGAKKPWDVALTRANVIVDAVKYHREGDVGYIRLPTFNEKTDDGLRQAVRDLKRQIGPGIKGYVLDLRNNPGGLLDEAVAVSDDLLNGGEIVSTKGRNAGDNTRYDARGGDITDGKPIIVLINAGTASASEIVAGALKDDHRATIIGMTSFGKGSVQTILPLSPGNGALRLTTARYYTPSGHSIQALGITPDTQVAEGDENDAATKLERESEAQLPGHLQGEKQAKKEAPVIKAPAGKKFDDFQLSYALDLLHGKPMKSADAN